MKTELINTTSESVTSSAVEVSGGIEILVENMSPLTPSIVVLKFEGVEFDRISEYPFARHYQKGTGDITAELIQNTNAENIIVSVCE